jgi:hypothetical protein
MQAFNRYRCVLEDARPTDWKAGKEWYDSAHERISDAASKAAEHSSLNAEHLTALFCDAVAVLSPMTDWDRNLAAVDSLVRAYRDDYPDRWKFEVLSRHTAYNSNAQRALNVLKGEARPSGPKVEAFAANLKGAEHAVTIDRHMLDVVDTFGLKSATGNAIRSCKRAVRMVATLHDVTPRTAQATIWSYVRRR